MLFNYTYSKGSELLLGGIDQTHFTGIIVYAPVNGSVNYWQFHAEKYVAE